MIRHKIEIIDALEKQYSSFIGYLNGLSTNEFLFAHQSKWSASQQLKHIVLSVQPLVQVFGMPKTVLEKKFGTKKGPSSTFDTLVAAYLEQLDQGGKAPKRYLPEIVLENEKSKLLQDLQRLIATLKKQIDIFTEKELDSLCVPHPLLGTISLREMLFNVIYHVGHHQNLTENNLKNM